MTIYVIVFDFWQANDDGTNVAPELAKTDWTRLSRNAYAIDTAETPDEVRARFDTRLGEEDDLYVFALEGPYYGFGPPDTVEWLDGRLTSNLR